MGSSNSIPLTLTVTANVEVKHDTWMDKTFSFTGSEEDFGGGAWGVSYDGSFEQFAEMCKRGSVLQILAVHVKLGTDSDSGRVYTIEEQSIENAISNAELRLKALHNPNIPAGEYSKGTGNWHFVRVSNETIDSIKGISVAHGMGSINIPEVL